MVAYWKSILNKISPVLKFCWGCSAWWRTFQNMLTLLQCWHCKRALPSGIWLLLFKIVITHYCDFHGRSRQSNMNRKTQWANMQWAIPQTMTKTHQNVWEKWLYRRWLFLPIKPLPDGNTKIQIDHIMININGDTLKNMLAMRNADIGKTTILP